MAFDRTKKFGIIIVYKISKKEKNDMKLNLKLFVSLVFVLLLSAALAVCTFAADTTNRPSETPTFSGWVVDGSTTHSPGRDTCTATHPDTNIRWELHNTGTTEAPNYTLYLYIDDESYATAYPEGAYAGKTAIHAFYFAENTEVHGYGWGGADGELVKNYPWIKAGAKVSQITKIVIEEGITELKYGTFSNMTYVTSVEMPTTLTTFSGAVFKGCQRLTSIYTRGQTPTADTFDFSKITTWGNTTYMFAGCESVKHIKFNPKMTINNGAVGSKVLNRTFIRCFALEDIDIPEGFTALNTDAFYECQKLKSITIPSTATNIVAGAFWKCTSLTTVTFKGNTTIKYAEGATTKEGVIAGINKGTNVSESNCGNTFSFCTALTTIIAPKDSPAYTFAKTFGFTAEEYKGESLYRGTFVNAYYKNATWTWDLYSDGTLYIGGSAADGSTNFYYGGNWNNVPTGENVSASRSYIPWCATKDAQGEEIRHLVKKVVIEESTGITTLGIYALGYLPNMTELVIPSTVKELGTSVLSTSSSLKTISVHGVTDAGEGIYDFRNIVNVSSHALSGAAMYPNVTGGIQVWFSDKLTSLPSVSDGWNWFCSYLNREGKVNTGMTQNVTFKVPAGTFADQILSAYVARQTQTDTTYSIDTSSTTSVSLAYFGIGGNCKDDYSGYKWAFDEKSGVLTISGTSTSTTLGFTTAASWDNLTPIPWHDYFSDITKVVIEEDTGITAIQGYALSQLSNCTQIVMPTTVSDLSAYNIFANNAKLSSIAYSEAELTENVYDLRYARTINGQLFESAAKDLTLTVKLSSGTVSINLWFTPSTTVNFYVYENSVADNLIKDLIKDILAGNDTRPEEFRFTIGTVTYMSANDNPLLAERTGTDSVNGAFSWELDLDTGTLTFTRLKTDWCELWFGDASNFFSWINDWRNEIKHVVVPEFSKYQNRASIFPFSNLPNLETVKWDTTRMMHTGSTSSTKGFFYDCPKLTTFGTSKTFEEGVINLSGFSLEHISTSVYSARMFQGCSSIKKVVFGTVSYKTGDTEASKVPLVIGTSMFEGCTALESVDFESVSGIMSGAFKNCENIKGTIYYSGDNTNLGDAFKGCGGVILIPDTIDKIVAIANSMSSAGVKPTEAFVPGMAFDSFSIRTSGYNGLRSLYTFAGETNLICDGLTLVEYGSICTSKTNYDNYTLDFGGATSILKLDGNEFKTPVKGIVKTAIYTANGYVGNDNAKKTVNDDGTVSFAVTIKNFADKNIKSDAVMLGYEIWKDTDGNYFVIFTNSTNEDFKVVSLYKATIAMLLADVVEIGAEDSPVYKMINAVDKTNIDLGIENVTACIIDHHIKEGKKIAIYRTTSETPIELETLGLPTDQLAIVVDYIFDNNITFDIPDIPDYWKAHINAQLSTLPAGKSFIALTDTHYPQNAGKSGILTQYIRKMTGIKTVVHLGDSYHDGSTREQALERFKLAMETNFFDLFGGDGLYAVGNHDSNITYARGAGDSLDYTYKMDLLLTDEEIYNRTFKHTFDAVENNEVENVEIVYDTKLINIIEELHKNGEIQGFVLGNVPAESAGSNNNMFGTVNYTAEQMYQNLLYWAKMHYAYYDHGSKVCYLVLNTGALTISDFATLKRELWAFHPSQYEFMYDVLMDVAANHSDYDVVVAGHMFYDRLDAGQNYRIDFFKMLSAFEAGTSVSFSASGNNALSGKLFGCTDGAKSRTLSFDFSGNAFTGEVICITGHTHIDRELVSQTKDGTYYQNVDYDTVSDNLSDNAINLFMLNQDNWSDSPNSVEAAEGIKKGVYGTITEQSFTIFTITDKDTVVMTKIGAQSDWGAQKAFKLG